MKNKVSAASTLALAMMYLPAGVVLAQNADQGTQAAQGTDAAAATAQTAQGTGAAAGQQLQEVVVTAERRATNLQTTPIAIQAISGDQLQSQHVNIITDLSLEVPAFQDYSPDNWLGSFEIRGVGSSVSAENTQQGVAVLRDGMLMSESVAQDEPFFDIADTEVLEGPQGTLVGANALGGALEINSANPNFRGMNGYIEGQLGNYSDRMFQGAVNLPVNDIFAARLAFYDQNEGSFYKDIGATTAGYFVNASGGIELMNQFPGAASVPTTDPGHVDEQGARLSLLWQPTDNFQAIGKAEFWTDSNGGLPLQPSPYTYQTLLTAGPGPTYAGCTTRPAATNYPGATGSQLVCPSAGSTIQTTYYYPGEKPFVLDFYGQEMYYDETQYHYSLDLNYTLPGGTVLRSQSGFNHIYITQQNNGSYGPQDAGWQKIITGPNDDYMSQEVNLISPTTGKFNWIAGGYWYYRDTEQQSGGNTVTAPYQPNTPPSVLAILSSPGVLRIAAGFAQANWQFARTLQLQVGVRGNWDANFSSNMQNVSPPSGTTLSEPDGTGIYQIHYTGTTPSSYTVLAQSSENYPGNHQSDFAPTGKIDLNWVPVPGQNFYAFYARGYKSGGANQGSNLYPSFKPESLNDWELGWKGQAFDNHMLTQVGAYYYDYQHMQVPFEDVALENDTSIGGVNGNLQGDSTLYGLTFSEQARFGGLGVNLNFSYEHSKLGALTTLNSAALPPGWGSPVAIPQCLPGHAYGTAVPGFVQGCFNYTPYLVNVGGEQNPYAPEISGNLSVDYNFRVGQGVIDPRVTVQHTDKQYTSIFQNEGYYTLLGARNVWDASVDWIVGKWDAQLYTTNFTNDTYLLSNGASTGSGAFVYYGPPRQAGVQVTYKF